MYHDNQKLNNRRQTEYSARAGLGVAAGLAMLASIMLLASAGNI